MLRLVSCTSLEIERSLLVFQDSCSHSLITSLPLPVYIYIELILSTQFARRVEPSLKRSVSKRAFLIISYRFPEFLKLTSKRQDPPAK